MTTPKIDFNKSHDHSQNRFQIFKSLQEVIIYFGHMAVQAPILKACIALWSPFHTMQNQAKKAQVPKSGKQPLDVSQKTEEEIEKEVEMQLKKRNVWDLYEQYLKQEMGDMYDPNMKPTKRCREYLRCRLKDRAAQGEKQQH